MTCSGSYHPPFLNLASDFLRTGLVKFLPCRRKQFIFLLTRMLPDESPEFVYSFQPLITVDRQVRDLLKNGLKVRVVVEEISNQFLYHRGFAGLRRKAARFDQFR